ncbi:malonyl-CoA decarboxylase family protein, partial [Mesorhizobium sp. M8A.F.Ca.ET.167.01.1.1]|uniref:malonyl-CoA decarboxylase domain-containing protein n=1 Tax=Mesorhizobium sp. M8A.F.Ca.ET.167.01.1.1 TaxID=2563961 RepID=UPI001138B5FC
PALLDEPLIFVEIALCHEVPSAIQPLLAHDRTGVPAGKAKTAVFYSISNCQQGLSGVSFGNFLIKQVVEELRRDLPGIKTFATLSPVPGFVRWMRTVAMAGMSAQDRAGVAFLDDPHPGIAEAVGRLSR